MTRAPRALTALTALTALQPALTVALTLCTIIAPLVMAGCPQAGTESATTATAAPSPPWWMSLKDGRLHRGLDEAPIGLYAAGDVEKAGAADRFVPGGDIEGQGPIGAPGTVGWLDLATGKFIASTEPAPPPPYVEGTMTPSGFSPKTRKITY